MRAQVMDDNGVESLREVREDARGCEKMGSRQQRTDSRQCPDAE